MYLDGPRLGPLHTVLWSSRSTKRRPVRRSNRSLWHRRFTMPLYWLLGIFALEAGFWALYAMVWLTRWAVQAIHRP